MSYTAEINQEKLIVKTNKGKVKLELAIQTIAPFISLGKVMVDDETKDQA